MSRKSYCSI